jgi:hypothetical protein
MRELARHLDDPLVPAGQMHDHHDPGTLPARVGRA